MQKTYVKFFIFLFYARSKPKHVLVSILYRDTTVLLISKVKHILVLVVIEISSYTRVAYTDFIVYRAHVDQYPGRTFHDFPHGEEIFATGCGKTSNGRGGDGKCTETRTCTTVVVL